MRIEIKVLAKEFYCERTQYVHNNKIQYKLLSYMTSGSAAMDLICTEDVILYPGEVKAIHTGLAVWIGASTCMESVNNFNIAELVTCAGLIVPRSGLGTKGLVLANTVGVIDEDYQGELIVQAWNRNQDIIYPEKAYEINVHKPFNPIKEEFEKNTIELKAGDRFAQLMFVPIIKAQWDMVEEFSFKTSRNISGFGSTGI